MKRGSAVDNTHRRTWDKTQYAQKAAEKDAKPKGNEGGDSIEAKRRRRWEIDPLHQGLITQRANLKPRERSLDLAARVGKTQVITASTPIDQQGAYYCSICDCTLHDSISYLDHLNGKWHNRALGMSMRVDRSTVEQVKARLEQHKKKPITKRKERPEENKELQLEYKSCSETEGKEDVEKNDLTPNNKEDGSDSDNGLDAQAAALMGFSGFASSKT